MKKYQSALAHGSILVLAWIVAIVIVSFASFGIIGTVSVIAASVVGGIGGCLWAINGTRTSRFESSLPDYEFEHAEFDHEEADAQNIVGRDV